MRTETTIGTIIISCILYAGYKFLGADAMIIVALALIIANLNGIYTKASDIAEEIAPQPKTWHEALSRNRKNFPPPPPKPSKTDDNNCQGK